MYKTISDSLSNKKKYELLCVKDYTILSNLVLWNFNFEWVLWMIGNIINLKKKHVVVQRFILMRVTIMHNNLYMQYLLKVHVNGLIVKWIFMQHNFLLSDFLSEFLIHFNAKHSSYKCWNYLNCIPVSFILSHYELKVRDLAWKYFILFSKCIFIIYL